MDTFPYESWEEAIADADGVAGYFTFGPGDNMASVIIALLAIALCVFMMFSFITRENKHLTEAAAELSDKYRGV